MPLSNNLNPDFLGKVKAGGFDAVHGKGVSVTAVTLAGTTVTDIFAAVNGFVGTVTGVFYHAIGATADTVTLKGANGATVAAITASSTLGLMVGPTTALTNTAISLAGTMTVASSSASALGILYVFYKVAS